MDGIPAESETGLLDLFCTPTSQLELLTEDLPLDTALAQSLQRLVQDITQPTDIVVAKFDSCL
jgi:hypothetical protein